MRFTKMHGTGNDYVYVDASVEVVPDPAGTARAISDRHTGVGADGLILIRPSDKAAVRMEMYNADGSRSQMCGNGLRCVAKYAYDHGMARDATFPIETDDGIKIAECTIEGGRVSRVRIDMGRPRFAPAEIPVNLSGEAVVDHPIEINGRAYAMTCVSMGNPHAVLFIDDLAAVNLAYEGSAIERHPLFPQRVNAHFAKVESPRRVTVLTWERGTGRTMACGTGVSAVCRAGARTGRTQRRITARTEGGDIDLEWADDDHIYKTGPAVEVSRVIGR